MRLRLVELILAVSLLSATANAGTLYTVRTSDDMLRSLDTETLQFTDIGPIGTPSYSFGGLAYDSLNQTMYMVAAFHDENLYTVDLDTGAAEVVGSHGFVDMVGLAYDSSTDTLYSGRTTIGTGFYSLDRSDGSATLIGNPGIDLDGLAYDSTRDMIVSAFGGDGDLYEIDRSDATPTMLTNGPWFNNCGLAYDPDSDLLWLIDTDGKLFTFDPNNSYSRTLVMSGLDAHEGLAWVPGPLPCQGDLDGDGDTDQADLGTLLAAYNVNDLGDLDGDGDTDQSDLGILLADYGCGVQP